MELLLQVVGLENNNGVSCLHLCIPGTVDYMMIYCSGMILVYVRRRCSAQVASGADERIDKVVWQPGKQERVLPIASSMARCEVSPTTCHYWT